jgi:uncharacterized membrane protein
MAKRPLTECTSEELETSLRKLKVVQITTVSIFGAIIAIWIFGGYVAQNIPVFISTLALAFGISAIQYASISETRKELTSRRKNAEVSISE